MALIVPHHATVLRQNYSLSESERHTLLCEWNQTARDYPRDSCIHHLFEEQVERTPEATALIDGEYRLTYSELNERANQLAHHLRGLGVGADTLVGVCVERNWRMVVAIMAVLKAGGAYVPLDPKYPPARLAFMLDDTKAPVLLTTQSSSTITPGPETAVVCLNSCWAEMEKLSRRNPARKTTASDLADVIYTSGSTGVPKGVALEHHGAVALACWAREVFSDQELAGVLASTSICFDLSVFELFVPLCWGGKVILAENALALPKLAAKDEVTLLNTVPSAIRELLRIKGVSQSIRVVNLAGEPLATEVVNQIHAQTSVQKVYDLYGPTETTTYSTFALRSPNQPPTIGRPLSNETAYLLDEFQQLVPIGAIGELYLGGDGLARGYLNRPELTREKFVPHPFQPGQRLYRTGDLARWRTDGNLEYLGRVDLQVKIRGYRVELGEIEAALNKLPGIRESVVVAKDHPSGQKTLVAYVVQKEESVINPSVIRKALKEEFPDYMVPSSFITLERLPLTTSGKVDRKHLSSLPVAPRNKPQSPYSNLSPVQLQMARIWEEVLHINPVGVEDTFFDLGGDSLLAFRLVERINEKFGVALDPAVLIASPTVAALARVVATSRQSSSDPHLVLVQDGSTTPSVCFLSPPLDLFWMISEAPFPFPLFATGAPFRESWLRASKDEDIKLYPNVAQMAETHVDLILKRSLKGSIILSGYSYNGILAFEVAHQLQKHGIEVPLVCLFDTNIPLSGWNWLRGMARHYCRKMANPRVVRPTAKLTKQLPPSPRTPSGRQNSEPEPSSSASQVSQEWPLMERLWKQAVTHYRPISLPTRGVLLKARETIYGEKANLDGCLGWSSLFQRGLDVKMVEGDHFSMWKEPHVRNLSEAWRHSLERWGRHDTSRKR